MKLHQHANQDSELKSDFLAWRVMNAKRRQTQIARNKEYNLRPRLRDESHIN